MIFGWEQLGDKLDWTIFYTAKQVSYKEAEIISSVDKGQWFFKIEAALLLFN